jgi:putative nucleotidyltransferase with HDIG domain
MDKVLLRKKIEGARELPTLSSVVAKVTEMIRDPRISTAQVAAAISEDPALTARTLKLVNSAFYGFPQRVNSVSRAIVILGFNNVRNLVMTASVFDKLSGKAASSLFPMDRFWEHSIATAVAADATAKALHFTAEQEDAFVAGLLHDIGKVALVHVLPKMMESIQQRVASGGWIGRAEEAELETTHQDVGLWLVEKWNFPPGLCQAVRLHHRPEQAREHRRLVMVVHLADLVARGLNVGSGGDRSMPPVSDRVWGELDLSEETLDRCFAGTVEGLGKAGAFFEMIRGGAAAGVAT